MNQNLICQSCSMPIKEESHIGTNLDGSRNQDYCVFCYKDGAFLQDVSMEEFIENSLQFSAEVGMSREEMREYCKATLPKLKRWHCTCTEACASGYNPDCTCTSSECHCRENHR
ncbi:hypothetical protein M2140_001007 [Clostridiales Family XIII bacterium PM5-7]